MENIKVNSKVVVFGEIYSPNVGDGVIFESIKYIAAEHNVDAIPCDLSGRSFWQEPSSINHSDEKVSLARKLCRIPMRRSRTIRRIYSALMWYLHRRQKVSLNWERIIASSDAVIIGGGQLLTDIDFGFPPKIHEVAKLARRYKKPLAFFGCGVGSGGWGYCARRLYKISLRDAQYISVRDQQSATIMKRYIPSASVDVHPDPAFIVSRLFTDLSKIKNEKKIGFNLQPALHFRSFVPGLNKLSDEDYINFWVTLIRDACNSGVVPIVFTNGDPADHAVAEAVVQRLSLLGLNVRLQSRPLRPSHLIEQISELSALVSTRMHAGIIGYGLGKSIVPIAWDQKVFGVWSQVGNCDIVQESSLLLNKDPWKKIESSISYDFCNSYQLQIIIEEINSAGCRCIQALGLQKE